MAFVCAVWMGLCAAPDARADIPSCARYDATRAAGPDAALPNVAICLRRAGIATTDAKPVDGLFSHAERDITAGRFDEAERALHCADVVLGDTENALARYQWVRLRGILDYRRERIPEALSRFECALALATAREDRAARAKDLKNVGSALRRLGDFRGALLHLTESLDIQRADGAPLGSVLNNIGDVYRELGEPEIAERYYRDAIDDFQRHRNPVQSAHVLETLSGLALDRGDIVEATRSLETALAVGRKAGDKAYRLRIYAVLIRLALAESDLAKAERRRSAALAMADEYDLPLPAPLQLEAARVDRFAGRFAAARVRLRTAIATVPEGDVDRPALLRELAAVLESEGDAVAAIETLRRAHDAESRIERAKYDRQLAWARTRFEAVEREHRIAALEVENRLRRAELRQRTLLLWSIVASVLALSGGGAIWLLRRRHRARLAETARQARYEEELTRYRQQAAALDVDRRLLKALFDDRDDAVCVVDAEGVVLTINRAACEALAVAEEAAVGGPFAECLRADQREAFHDTLERMEDAAASPLAANRVSDDAALRMTLSEWARDGGLILLEIAPGSSEFDETASIDPSEPSEPSEPTERAEDSSQHDFRRALVELMLAVVDAWERHSGSGRLELAEKSRIWRVTIDDGRLRARAMERYLSLSKLPKNPRWRDVLRSAYFVLGQGGVDAAARTVLQDKIDAVLAFTRRSALA
ncbi:MAG: tetratricopeptide repeat protein [Lysobacter sp.]|nr:tetratricopeptide repeat protein [Lysobacter sp.]